MGKFQFKRPVKKRIRLRLAVSGVAGSGKTYSALAIAQGLGDRVAVIDSERGSSSLYMDRFSFEMVELDYHSPGEYMSAIREAADQGFDVLVIDSLSHAWAGDGGVLDISRKSVGGRGNAMGNWKEASPLQEKLIGTILDYPGHVIVTMRSKMEYVISEKNGRVGSVEKVGLAPVQRQGVEYEFDIVGEIADQTLSITKSRIPGLQGRDFHRPGADVAKTLRQWIEGGDTSRFAKPEPRDEPEPEKEAETTEQTVERLRERLDGPKEESAVERENVKTKRVRSSPRARTDLKPLDAPKLSGDSFVAKDWKCYLPSEIGKKASNAMAWQSMICDQAKAAKADGSFDSWREDHKAQARLAWTLKRDRYTSQIAEYDALLSSPEDGSAKPSDEAAFDLDITDGWRKDVDQLKRVRDKLRRRAEAEGKKTESEAF